MSELLDAAFPYTVAFDDNANLLFSKVPGDLRSAVIAVREYDRLLVAGYLPDEAYRQVWASGRRSADRSSEYEPVQITQPDSPFYEQTALDFPQPARTIGQRVLQRVMRLGA